MWNSQPKATAVLERGRPARFFGVSTSWAGETPAPRTMNEAGMLMTDKDLINYVDTRPGGIPGGTGTSALYCVLLKPNFFSGREDFRAELECSSCLSVPSVRQRPLTRRPQSLGELCVKRL